MADSHTFRILAQLDVFIYIMAHSESMVYSGIFRTVDIFSRFRYEQCMHIMNLIWADSGIFSALACLGLSCFTHFQEYSLSYAYQGIFAHIRAYCSRFRHIQDCCITDPNSVKQHQLFKSGFSFKSLSRFIWNIFNFFSKVNIQRFFLRDSISVITITIIIAC